MKGILGRKVGMTQLLTEKGVVVPVTVIEAGPCYVTQIKTAEKDGYTATLYSFNLTFSFGNFLLISATDACRLVLFHRTCLA